MVKNKEIFVQKRDGSKALFDVAKIKTSIAFATDGQGVNPLHLEASLDQFVKNGITTSEIQDNVIRHAVQLASPQTPNWLNVAGRALAMQMWADYKLRNKTFLEIFEYNISKGEYTKELLKFYSKADIECLGKYLDQTRDLLHSHSSLITVQKKYLGKYELNQHMHMVNAMRFGQNEEKEIRIEFVKKLYDALSLRKISLATPFMSNLRKGGNTASCFIIAIEDDLDSIFDNVKRIARISKNGGGLGIFLGLLRAKGSSIGTALNAAGSVTQWVKIINDTLVAVNQSFSGETLICTDKGTKQIDKIVSGDKVLTHDGSYNEVLDIRSRKSDTELYKIQTNLGETVVTSGHPVLVVDKTDNLPELKLSIKSGKTKPFWIDASEVTPNHLILTSNTKKVAE